MKIDPDRYYRPQDPEMRMFAAVQTLAKLRVEQRGPPWTYFGNRVLYLGADILSELENNRVETKAA